MPPSRQESDRASVSDSGTAPSPGGDGAAPVDRGSELMLLWQGGDEEAFREIVDLYSGQVFALLTRFLGRRHPGREDMVQDVFLRVVGARDRYEPTARLSTWLYSIAWRMCVNETERSVGRQPVSFDAMGKEDAERYDPEDGQQPLPEEGLGRADIVRAVRAAIAELPETQRIAVVLARYHDMSYSEIADVVDSSEKAIKSLIHRARETLRVQLQPLFESEVA